MYLKLCSNYAVDHSLSFDAKKSFLLCFIPKIVNFSSLKLYLDKHVTPYVSECRYLDIIICQKNCGRNSEG